MKKLQILILFLFLISCTQKKVINNDNKSNLDYQYKDEYEKALQSFDYWQYRNYLLWTEIDNQDFYELEKEINKGELIGNQIHEEYMQSIKTLIYLKNNKSFGNIELDNQYSKLYNWYIPSENVSLTGNENKIIQQINKYLEPNIEQMDISELSANIKGIWQIDTWQIYSACLQTIRFTDDRFEIIKNEMLHSERFQKITGRYEIKSNNIILFPEVIESIANGQYFETDDEGLIQDFIGGKKVIRQMPLDSVISYTVLNLQKLVDNPDILKIEIVTDKPHNYYKIRE